MVRNKAAFHTKGLIFSIVMLSIIIEGNKQAAAQGNTWQDGVNALVMLQKILQSMHAQLFVIKRNIYTSP